MHCTSGPGVLSKFSFCHTAARVATRVVPRVARVTPPGSTRTLVSRGHFLAKRQQLLFPSSSSFPACTSSSHPLVARCFSSFSSSSSTPPAFRYITCEQKGYAVHITMNRPEIHNAFDEVLIEELTVAFSCVLRTYPTARVVVLTGSGKSFSAGADMKWMAKMVDYSKEANKEDSLKLFDMFQAIKTLQVPTVARVNGAALGGGAGLVASCDIAVVVDDATLGFTEVGIGLIPAVISGFVMEKIGRSAASRYFLTGERFDATEALRIGLVSDICEGEEDLDIQVEWLTDQLSGVSPAATVACKALIQEVSGKSPVECREYVADQISAIRVSKEGQSGLRAFLTRTKPDW